MTAERDALLAELAPEDRRGYPPAYYFAIRRDIHADDLSPDRLAGISRELDWLSEVGLDEGDVAALRVACLLRMGRLSDAQELLRSAHLSPMIRVVAARTFASLDMRDAAMSQAKIATQELAERLAKRDTVAERLLWAEAEGILGNPRGVEAILRTGASLHPQGPFTRDLARLQLQLVSDAAIDGVQKAALIEGGLRLLARLPADDPARATLMWRFHLARGDSQRAGEALSAAAARNSRTRLDLARFEATHGGIETSRALATTVAEDCRVVIAASPNRRSVRLLYAEALVFLRDYEAATAALDEAWQKIHDPEYAVALSRTYLACWDAKRHETQTVSIDDLALLEHAAHYCPTSIELTKRLRKARQLLAASDADARNRLEALARINLATSNDTKL
jgi:tetratricopeptide (TPR) repeat protein